MHRRAAMAAGRQHGDAGRAGVPVGRRRGRVAARHQPRSLRALRQLRPRLPRAPHVHAPRSPRPDLPAPRARSEGRRHEHIMLPSSCRHCRDPECMIGCPTGAIQRFADGDVDINDNCIGCENCARKCPYGNITMRPLDEKERPSPEITKRAIKCNLCRGYALLELRARVPARRDPARRSAALLRGARARDGGRADATRSSGRATRPSRSACSAPSSRSGRARPGSSRRASCSASLASPAIVAATVLSRARRCAAARRSACRSASAPRSACSPRRSSASASGCATRRIGGLEAWTQFHMVLGARRLHRRGRARRLPGHRRVHDAVAPRVRARGHHRRDRPAHLRDRAEHADATRAPRPRAPRRGSARRGDQRSSARSPSWSPRCRRRRGSALRKHASRRSPATCTIG